MTRHLFCMAAFCNGGLWQSTVLHGNIMKNRGKPRNTPEVIWGKVDVRDEMQCWPWKSWCGTGGYGRVEIDGKSYYAHRVIFDLSFPGVIYLNAPEDRRAHGYLMHTCDNPKCCNPLHLKFCTHAENMADKKNKGRCPDFKGEKGPRAKLSLKDVEEIRWIASKGIAASESGKIYGVHKSTIKHAINGRHYGG